MTACFIELFNVCYYFTYFSRMEKHKEKLDSLAMSFVWAKDQGVF